MGAGKSRLGKRLAKRMNYSFIDADQAIEKENDATVQELFETLGEDGFRELETKWLKELDAEDTIISLGGGTPCFNDNMALILEKGKSIYLELGSKVLLDRLQNAKGIRPLIEPIKHDSEALLQFITEKLAEREVFYKQANFSSSAISLSSERLDRLVDLVKKAKGKS